MSQIRYKYANEGDESTIFLYSGQEEGLPASNVLNEILAKKWRTKTGFSIYSGNINLPFKDSSTSSVVVYGVTAGDYTGSGLAAEMQSGMDSVGIYPDHRVKYNSGTKKFTIGRTSTTTGAFELHFAESAYEGFSLASICGFAYDANKTGASEYTSTTTLGVQGEIVLQLTSTVTCSAFIMDKHDFGSAVSLQLRGSKDSATTFHGMLNSGTLTLDQALTWNSSVIVYDFSEVLIKTMQLYWWDHGASKTYAEIGRMFIGKYFEPANHPDNVIDYSAKKIDHRSRQTLSEAGVTFFDKRDPINEWSIPVDPLSVYYNSATKTGFEDMIGDVRNDKSFYVTFQSSDLNGSTVYGYLVGDLSYTRHKNTPVFRMKNLRLREQK